MKNLLLHSRSNTMVNNGVLYPSTRGALEVDSSVYLEMPRAETIRSVEVAPIHPSPPQQLMPAHLKCGMWASFTLATLFVAGAKFYFDHQVSNYLILSVYVMILRHRLICDLG